MLSFKMNFSAAQWVRKADGIKPRSEVRETIVYNSKLYAFLGFSDTMFYAEPSAEVYDPATNKWTALAALPPKTAMTHQNSILIDNTVWHIGGRIGKHPGPMTSLIWIYNITTNTWSRGPVVRDPATGDTMVIAGAGAVLLGRTLHIFGGFTPTACIDQSTYHLTLDVDTWLANPSAPAQWQNKLKPMPMKRCHFSTAVLGGKIYAIGGQSGHDCGSFDVAYCHVYNPATDTWTQLPSLPTARSHAEGSTFAIDGKIYIAGGQGTDNNSTKYVTVFDPAANSGAGKWTENTSLTLPSIWEGLSATVIGSTFILSHGSQGPSKYPVKLTYSRTLTRTPVYKLGFPKECVNLNDSSANSLKGKSWLFTIDGSKTYTTSSNVSWLTVTKNAIGTTNANTVEIEVTANPTGLAPGNYSGTITATGTGVGTTYTAATLCVNLTVQSNTPPAQYSLTVTANGSGTVTKSPNQASYSSGTVVSLSATPVSGQQFTGWSGDATGTTNPLSVTMNGNKNIIGNFAGVPASLITNVTATTGHKYVLTNIAVDTLVYTDRTYRITSVPALLNNAPFIKTPNDDKAKTSTTVLSFTLTQNATVYVAYDPRATALPTWLSSWQKLTSQVGFNDIDISYMKLFSKTFSAGKVSLGGNLASPAVGAKSNYFVIALPQQSQQLARSVNNISSSNQNAVNAITEKDKMKGLDFKVYPNPGHGGKIFIEANNLQKQELVTVIVQDVSGKIIQSMKVSADDLGTLNKNIFINKSANKGFYIIKLNSASGSAQKELIIN
jgi:N-acetylneuraminic acid mutarotase